MKKLLIFVATYIYTVSCIYGQGLNHHFLLGYQSGLTPYTTSKRAVAEIDSFNFSIFMQTRKMPFESCQSNISDSSGNLLMATNGQWIMDATHDTMSNGSGINPGNCTNAWMFGLPVPGMNIILPYPGNSSRYVLIHQTCNDGQAFQGLASEIYYSVIDMDSANGFGKVIVKNQIILQDTLSLGMTACKHANGRDWWVSVFKDSTDIVFTILIDPSGVSLNGMQHLNILNHDFYNSKPMFSPDGKQFAFNWFSGVLGNALHTIRVLDFNRCSGIFSNPKLLTFKSYAGGQGVSFSSNSRYLYANSFDTVYQFDTYATNIQASRTIVGINDNYCWPYNFTCTDFWTMYLAANGWIYISSGNGVLQNHYIEFPDSVGLACNMHLHTIQLPCWSYRGNVNHPNYYLGCDTTLGCGCATGYNQYTMDDSKFNIYPNPNNGNFNIGYKAIATTSKLRLIDVNGKTIYTQTLPPWSNEQSIKCMLTKGVYVVRIENGSEYVSRKMVVIDN